ncbi:MAG: hypothetical protein ACKVLN_01575 [Rhodobacterales bacterium]|jgi:hypothetical protein
MRPVGADFGPDGFLNVLELGFSGSAIKSRVRRFDVTFAGLLTPKLDFASKSGQFDNLEAVWVWADPKGRFRLPMILYDNFNPLQQT